jgi:hypothetical protein
MRTAKDLWAAAMRIRTERRGELLLESPKTKLFSQSGAIRSGALNTGSQAGMSISALNSGFTGIHRSFNQMRQDASRIANAHNDSDDLTDPLLKLHGDKTQALASIKVIAAADTMIGSVLDIKV